MVATVVLFDGNIAWRRASHGSLFYPVNCTKICRGLFGNEKGLILQTRQGWMSWSPTFEASLESTIDASEKGDVS
jgi:hypothetical protein